MEEYTDALVTLPVAKLAKEKGFKEFCRDSFDITHTLIPRMCCTNSKGDEPFTSAPTQTALQKWLREKHNIHISVILDQTIHMKYWYKIIECKKWDESIYVEIKPDNSWLHLRYEEALEEALQEALKYIS